MGKALARGDALGAEVAGDPADRMPLEVALEDLAHDLRLGGVDLKVGVDVLPGAHEAVAVGRGAEHRVGSLAGAVELAAPRALGDLGPLVLGDHSAKLAQELILGRIGFLRLVREETSTPQRSSSSSNSTW